MKPPKSIPPRLAEGEDYYFERGLMVFTASYHAKRGSCCGNGCRHCPYEPHHVAGNTRLTSDPRRTSKD